MPQPLSLSGERPPERDRLAGEPPTPTFRRARFSAFFNRSSLRILSDGQMSVTFLVPSDAVDAAMPIRYLAANPLPLTVTVEVNTDYLSDVEDDEQRLRAM